MPTAELQALLSLDNKPFIRGMNASVAQANKAGAMMTKSLESIGGPLKEIGGMVAGAFSVGAIAAFGKQVIDFAGNLQDSADVLNINVETLQGLQGAFEQSGVSAEKFDKAMIELTKSLEEASDGNETTVAAFEDLGVTWKNLRDSSPEEILMKIADGLEAAKTPMQDLSTIFGKFGPKMAATFKAGGEGLAKMVAETKKLSEKDIRAIDALGDAWSQFWRALEVAGGEAVANTTKEIEGLEAAARRAGKAISGLTIGGVFGVHPNAPAPTNPAENPTAAPQGELVPGAPTAGNGSTHARGRKLTDAESAKADEQAAEDEAANKDAAKSIEDRNKAESDFDAARMKNRKEIARLIRDEIFDEADGQQRLNILTAERGKIMEDAAKLGAYTDEQQLEYVRKSVEIARQIKANEEKDKEKDKESPEDKAFRMMMEREARNASNLVSEGVTSSGGLRGGAYHRGSEHRSAYHAIRAGDTARAKNAAKAGRDPQLAAITANTAALAKVWGAVPAH